MTTAAPPTTSSNQDSEHLATELLTMVEAARSASQRVVQGGTDDAPHDEEAVHDLRVALRRLRTLLGPLDEVYGKKQVRRIARALRDLARASGALRDEEVLHETLGELELYGEAATALQAWMVRRVKKEQRLRARLRKRLMPVKSEKPKLHEALDQLEARVRGGIHDEVDLRALAERALEQTFERVRELHGVDTTDAEAMHELRIRYKRLRYTAEVFKPLLDQKSSRENNIVKVAARMQKKLGELHDLEEAIGRVERSHRIDDSARAMLRAALVVRRARSRERAAHALTEARPMLTRPSAT